jgi:hypothetical protein
VARVLLGEGRAVPDRVGMRMKKAPWELMFVGMGAMGGMVWLWLLGGVVAETETRGWTWSSEATAKEGTGVEAKLVSRVESGESIILERVGGGTITVKLSDLAAGDREYVETVFPTVPQARGSRPEDLSEEALAAARALLPEKGKDAVIHHVLSLAPKAKLRVEMAVDDGESEQGVFFETDRGDELWALLKDKQVYGIEMRDLNHRNRVFRAAPSGGSTYQVKEGRLRIQVENFSEMALTVVLYSARGR